jgi:hypothetical protein
MITNRDTISRIRSTHRLLSADGSLNDRSILAEARSISSLLIKRALNLRKLSATDSIYTTIPCLELKEVPISECCDYVDPCMIARTKLQLPKIGESNYLYAIQGVFAINQKVKLKEITPTRYINLLKLPVVVKDVYYWIQNNYLYVTNPDINKVKLSAYFAEDVPIDVLYPADCDCANSVPLSELCKNPLDAEFKCPADLIDNTVDMTSKRLLGTYFRLPEDIQDDTADGQATNKNGK